MNLFKLSIVMLICFSFTVGYSDENSSEADNSEPSSDSSTSSNDADTSIAETIFRIASDPGASAGGDR